MQTTTTTITTNLNKRFRKINKNYDCQCQNLLSPYYKTKTIKNSIKKELKKSVVLCCSQQLLATTIKNIKLCFFLKQQQQQ